MLKFLIPFSFLFCLGQYYLYRKFHVFFPKHTFLFAVSWISISVIILFLTGKEIFQSFSPVDVSAWVYGIGFIWIGFAFLLIFCFGTLDLSIWLAKKFHLVSVYNLLASRKISAILTAIVFIATAYGFFKAQQINPFFVEIPVEKLPHGIEKIRIVQLSDIHINPLFKGEKIEQIVNLVNEQQADFVMITGDTVERNMTPYQAEAQLLAQIKARQGRFIIEGNHEHYAGIHQALDFLQKTGFTLLRNQIAETDHIVIIGETDPAKGSETAPVVPKIDYDTLEVGQDKFVILLKHQPTIHPESRRIVDLQLSGHTHRGQIGPFYWLTRLLFNYPANLSEQGNIHIYISNGTGFWGPPIRLFAPPEITVIDLVKKAP